jgi:hypothetical protein
MTVEDNRIAHLRAIVEAEAKAADGRLRSGYRAVATATGLGEEYIYQLYTDKRKKVGSDAARAISRAYRRGRSEDWFDFAPMPNPISKAGDEVMRAMPTLGQTILHLGSLLGTMNPLVRASLAPLLTSVVDDPDSAYQAAHLADAIASAQTLDTKNADLKRALSRSLEAPVESDHAPLR